MGGGPRIFPLSSARGLNLWAPGRGHAPCLPLPMVTALGRPVLFTHTAHPSAGFINTAEAWELSGPVAGSGSRAGVWPSEGLPVGAWRFQAWRAPAGSPDPRLSQTVARWGVTH